MNKGKEIFIPEKQSGIYVWNWNPYALVLIASFLTDTPTSQAIDWSVLARRALQMRIRRYETLCCSMSFLLCRMPCCPKGIRQHLLMSCTCFWPTWLPLNISETPWSVCVKKAVPSLLPARISKTSTELMWEKWQNPCLPFQHISFCFIREISPRRNIWKCSGWMSVCSTWSAVL